MKEVLCLITVTLNFSWEEKSYIKKTLQKFYFNDESDKLSEIKKFVHTSLKISEIEKYSTYGSPKKKYSALVMPNEYGGHQEISSISIDYVLENEWTEE